MASAYDAASGLARCAARVAAGTPSPLPPLLALSDPARTPDPDAWMAGLPAGCAAIYRHFGADDRFETGARLARRARARDIVFLVSADPALADAVGADGLHWPETCFGAARRRRLAGDARLFTASAHSPAALRRALLAGLDAALLSPVFPSLSPSAGRPLGRYAAAAMQAEIDLPVYALGGVTERTGRGLIGLGFAGLASVGAAATAR